MSMFCVVESMTFSPKDWDSKSSRQLAQKHIQQWNQKCLHVVLKHKVIKFHQFLNAKALDQYQFNPSLQLTYKAPKE